MANFHIQHIFSDLLIILAVLVISLVTSYAVVTADDTDNHCDYSLQLNDPAARNKHLEMKAEMELIARVRKESLEAGTSRSRRDDLTSYRQLDEQSRKCVVCHELKGKMAISEIIEAYYPNSNSTMASIYATHAIGTDYVAASLSNSKLHRLEDLPPTMTLVNGRIACITCHNPLNPKRNSLAVGDSGSAFCFACHEY